MRKSQAPKGPPAYIGISKPDEDRVRRYDEARFRGRFSTRADFFREACDRLADQILGADDRPKVAA